MKQLLYFKETFRHIEGSINIGGEMSAVFAVIANPIAPVFIILGLVIRLAVLPLLNVTPIGSFIVHGNDPWAVGPLMYSMAYLLIFTMGPGKYLLDIQFFKIPWK